MLDQQLLNLYLDYIFEDTFGAIPKKGKLPGGKKIVILPFQVYQGPNGNWQARNKDNEHASFGNDYESFQAAMKFMHSGGNKPQPTPPEPAIDTGKLQAPLTTKPKVTKKTAGAKVSGQIIPADYGNAPNFDTVKDTTLIPKDTSHSDAFTSEPDIDAESFSIMNGEFTYSPNAFHFPDSIVALANEGKFPKKYISLLERIINTRETKDTIKWSHFSTEIGGAGTVPSQASELMVMMSLTMNDAQSKEYFASIKQHLEKNVPKYNKKLLVGMDWLESSYRQRNTILKRLQRKYPNCTIENACWDNPAELTALGLRSPTDKGTSADVFLKLRTADGQYVLDQNSLKKSIYANVVNFRVSKMFQWDPGLLQDLSNKDYINSEKSRLENFAENIKHKVQAVIATATPAADELNKFMRIEKFDTFEDALQSTKPNANRNRVLLEGIKLLARAGNEEAGQFLLTHIQASKDYQHKLFHELSTNKKVIDGMLNEIRVEFPIRSIANQTESMTIERYSLDSDTLGKIFGTNEYDKIKDRLYSFSGEPPYIGYQAGPEQEIIPIANIYVREAGLGWGGQYKLEMKFDTSFIHRLEDAQREIYGK